MRIYVLEDGHGLKKGLREVALELALALISKGYAVKENALDKVAYDDLQHAKDRDQAK